MKVTFKRFLKWALLTFGILLLLVLVAIPAFGLLRRGIGLQYAAQLLLEFFGPELMVILAVITVLLAWRWRNSKRRLTLAAMLLSAAGVIACGIVLGGYVSAARAQGVSINLAQTLWPQLPASAAPDDEFVYDHFDGEDVRLLVYRPSPSDHLAPVLVHFHGGGWVQGSASERAVDARWLAQRGYLVFDVDYSLSSNRRHLWNVTQPQLGCALAWISDQAASMGGDPRRLAIFGESAGGNLVLNLASLANAGALPSRCGGRVPRISAVISMYPPTDMPVLYAHKQTAIYPLAYVGGPPRQFPDRYAYVSPMSYVHDTGAPTLLLTGLEDSLVPVADTLRYVQLRRAAGYEIELIALPRAGHAFDAIPGSIGNQIFRQGALRFLRKHGLQP